MNIVDSSGWLEYFAKSNRALFFKDVIEDTKNLLIPSVTIFEVFKKMHKERGETTAVEAFEQMQNGKIADLDEWTSVLASKISVGENLGMADAVIYATALLHNATLWTQDSDFKGLPNVKYFPKP